MDSRHSFGLCILLAIALIGCGPAKPVRISVHGQVTVSGQAAEGGIVRFEPIGEEHGPARAPAMVPIVDGKYQVETGGGLQEGRYRVEVEVQHKTGRKITKQVFNEVANVDEVVLVSSSRYAGKDSPLEYAAQSSSNRRFDIDVPAK